MAAHRQPAHRDRDTGRPLPVTDRLTAGTLILPVFHQMTDSEQSRVVEALCGRPPADRAGHSARRRRSSSLIAGTISCRSPITA